jgi:hypothetical protein
MVQLQKTTVLHAALHAAMAITKWTTSVSLISVQAVKPNVQTAVRQARNRHAAAVSGEIKKIVRTTTRVIRPKQIVAVV